MQQSRSQQKIAMLFDTTRENIVQHIRNIYQEAELQEKQTRKNYLQVQTEGNRSVNFQRVDADKPMIGMTNFKGNYITRDDVKIAKNYLSERELQVLNLLVSQYLDFAELQAVEQQAMTMRQGIEKLDEILSVGKRPLLRDAGTISHKQAIEKATQEFEEYRRKEMLQYESDFDRAIRELKSQAGDNSNISE
ncbi:MAG: virulence RhuM family protein [Cytophagaceae bacterium]|nr:virulence RhuM family protein [Cytophagaceae bacterium]